MHYYAPQVGDTVRYKSHSTPVGIIHEVKNRTHVIVRWGSGITREASVGFLMLVKRAT